MTTDTTARTRRDSGRLTATAEELGFSADNSAAHARAAFCLAETPTGGEGKAGAGGAKFGMDER